MLLAGPDGTDDTRIPLGLFVDGHSRLVAVSVRAQQILVLDTDDGSYYLPSGTALGQTSIAKKQEQ